VTDRFDAIESRPSGRFQRGAPGCVEHESRTPFQVCAELRKWLDAGYDKHRSDSTG
jgi:hypothetical protein